MFRAIRRLALNLVVPAAVAAPVAIGLAYTPKEPDLGPIRSEFAHLRHMHYGPDEIVYLPPAYTPVRFGDLTGREPSDLPTPDLAPGDGEEPLAIAR